MEGVTYTLRPGRWPHAGLPDWTAGQTPSAVKPWKRWAIIRTIPTYLYNFIPLRDPSLPLSLLLSLPPLSSSPSPSPSPLPLSLTLSFVSGGQDDLLTNGAAALSDCPGNRPSPLEGVLPWSHQRAMKRGDVI